MSAEAASGNQLVLHVQTAGKGEKVEKTGTVPSPGSGPISKVLLTFRVATHELEHLDRSEEEGAVGDDQFRIEVKAGATTVFVLDSSVNLHLPDFPASQSLVIQWDGMSNEVAKELDLSQLVQESQTSFDVVVTVSVTNIGDARYGTEFLATCEAIPETPARVRPALAWDNRLGGLLLTWNVLGGTLPRDVPINVYFASGPAYANRLGNNPVFSHVVPAGTAPGTGGPVHIPGSDLAADPGGTTNLIAASSETEVGSLADVRIEFGPNADAEVVSDRMIEIVKDGLRAAGASRGIISSTARTPESQARAMFDNLVRRGPAPQFRLYGPAGDAVVQVYVDRTVGMTRNQIRANAAEILQAMIDEIYRRGPANVTHHCADPAEICVIDVAYSSFNSNNRPLFRAAVAPPRLTRLLDEPDNNCYHLELRPP